MDDWHLHEACGVFGCVATGDWPAKLDIRHIIFLGLMGLQHRGQESAGMVMSEGERNKFTFHKGMGQVTNVFSEEVMFKLKGSVGIGHTRYSTAGESEFLNCQPFVVHTVHGLIATAHNGELVNATSLRQKVMKHGVGLSTGCDSEIITQLLTFTPPEGEEDGPNWTARIRRFIKESLIAYSLVILHGDKIYAVRDPYGNRPLCIGKILHKDVENGKLNGEPEAWVVSSESCCFYSIGAALHREVYPGEVIEMSRNGIKTLSIIPRADEKPPAFCIFEYVYFARPDSYLEDQMVYNVRQRCGIKLALEAPVEADLVSTVPESATPAAMGYSEQSGIPYVEVLTRNRYVGRTFIQPSARLRELGVAKKFGPLTENLRNKRIVLIDDSIVRGTTMGPIVRLLKAAGAKEVHIRVASPPIHYPCYMGINIPTREELIANKMEIAQLAKHFGADSIMYLTVDGLIQAVQEGIHNTDGRQIGHCTACLTGNYPVPLDW